MNQLPLPRAGTVQRVVVNGRFLAQARTGVQRYGVETLRALDRLVGQDPQALQQLCLQLAVPCGAQVPLLDHFEIHTLPRFGGHAWEQLSLACFARGARLLNFSYSGPLFKRDQLITLHDAGTRADRASYTWRYRWAHDALTGWLIRRVDTVMTVSEFSRQEIAHHLGLPAHRLVVGREGGEHAVAHGDTLRQVRRLGLVPGRYLLAVGSRKASKNLALIGRALEQLPDIKLPVAVAGASDRAVFQGAQPVSRAFRLLGFVDDAELFALYRHAAWFILPSRYEGFGLPALEAMANGCPVLAANAASMPEVCGDAALYFDPQDPASLAALLRRVCSDGPLRTALQQRSAARLQQYRWEANARIVWEQLFPRPVPGPQAASSALPAAEAARSPLGLPAPHGPIGRPGPRGGLEPRRGAALGAAPLS